MLFKTEKWWRDGWRSTCALLCKEVKLPMSGRDLTTIKPGVIVVEVDCAVTPLAIPEEDPD